MEDMKSLFSNFLAGIAGGMLTLGGVFLLPDKPDPVRPVSEEVPAVTVRNTFAEPAAEAVLPNFREAAARAMPAVVHISASSDGSREGEDEEENYNPFRFFFDDDDAGNPFGDRPRRGSGSGVIYSPDGYIVTNYHVVEGADAIEVTTFDNRSFQAEVVGTYQKSDLAVIRIEANDLPTMRLADSDAAAVGEWVLAVGNPFDLNSTVTAGIISAKGRSLQLLGGRDAIEAFIQTDAAVNPGNSGGALVDADGNLLGINTAIATRTGVYQGYSFAIPVNLMRRIADDIIEHGSFQRAFLGVTIRNLDSDYARELGVAITQGVVIEQLVDGGSAQYAGLQPKDIIVEVDGRMIKGVPQLQEVIGRSLVGEVVQITVQRRGDRKVIPVKLKAG